MKFSSRTAVLVLISVLAMGLLSGCGADESVSVKSYNNSIVEVQKGMFAKAQEASKIFEQPNQEPQAVMSALKDIQTSISASHYQFREMTVPKGGEILADAMEKFFQIELTGIQDIIGGVQQLQGRESDPAVRKNFTDVYSRFSLQENQALKDFYATQQQVAEKYGQKVIQTDSN